MSDEKQPLWQRLRKDGPKEIALELAKEATKFSLGPYAAGAWLLMTTALAGWYATFEGIHPLWKLVGILAVLGFSLWVGRQARDWLATPDRQPTGESAASKAQSKSAFFGRYSSGRVEYRCVGKEVEGKKWIVIEFSVHNATPKTVRGVSVFLNSRTWTESGKFSVFNDSETVSLPAPTPDGRCHPSMGISFVLIAQSLDDRSKVILGDPADPEPARTHIKTGKTFITLSVSAEDQVPTTMNLLVVTTEKGGDPYAVEYDSRRWGVFPNTPTPYHELRPAIF